MKQSKREQEREGEGKERERMRSVNTKNADYYYHYLLSKSERECGWMCVYMFVSERKSVYSHVGV